MYACRFPAPNTRSTDKVDRRTVLPARPWLVEQWAQIPFASRRARRDWLALRRVSLLDCRVEHIVRETEGMRQQLPERDFILGLDVRRLTAGVETG